MNFFRSIYLKHRLLCPFCLGHIPWQKNLKICPHHGCGRELPVRYVHKDMLLQPLPVQVVGWEQHGKTTYLYALTLLLKRMPRLSCAAATEETQKMVQEVLASIQRGNMPLSTPKGADECYVMMLRGLEPWGERALLLRDCPGEVFGGMDIPVEHAPFLLRARTIFMFISLPDLLDQDKDIHITRHRTMDMLLNNYIDTLLRRGIPFLRQQRNVIVVLTKADLLPDLPAELREYLAEDTLWSLPTKLSREEFASFMERYLASMEQVDGLIRRWIGQTAPGRSFLQLAEDHRIHLRFSLISATGAQVAPGNEMSCAWEPRRVLDPLFWGLELERLGSSWVRFSIFVNTAVAKVAGWFDPLKKRSDGPISRAQRGTRRGRS
jgi:hypothetical protein